MSEREIARQSAVRTSEAGAILLVFALYIFAFATVVAVTVNSFFIGETVVQHRLAVESMSLAAAKLTLDADDVCADKRSSGSSEQDLLNCVFGQARIAGKGKKGCDGDFEIPHFSVQLSTSNNGSSDNSGGGKDDFQNSAYSSTNSNIQVSFGNYDKNTGAFLPASKDHVKAKAASVNALKMKVILPLADLAEVAPLVAFLQDVRVPMPVTFTSYAIAYRPTPSAPFQLAIDPDVSS